MAPDSNTKTQSLLMRSDLAKLGVPPQEVLRWLREGWVECLGELAHGDTPGDGDVVLGVTDPKLRDRLTADLALIGKGDAILAPARARAAMLRVLIDRHERVEESVPPAPAPAAPDLAAEAERLEHTAAEMLIETLGPAVDETLHDEAMDLLGDLEAHADQARRDEAATDEPSAGMVGADVPGAPSSDDDHEADWDADGAFEGFDADALLDLTAGWDDTPSAVDEEADEPAVDAAPPAASDIADEPAIVDEAPSALVEQTAEVSAPATPDAAEASVEIEPIESTGPSTDVEEIADAAAAEPIENDPTMAPTAASEPELDFVEVANEPATLEEAPSDIVVAEADVPAPATPDAAEASDAVGIVESSDPPTDVEEITDAAGPEPIASEPAITDEAASAEIPAPTSESSLEDLSDPVIDVAPTAASEPELDFAEEVANEPATFVEETIDAAGPGPIASEPAIADETASAEIPAPTSQNSLEDLSDPVIDVAPAAASEPELDFAEAADESPILEEAPSALVVAEADVPAPATPDATEASDADGPIGSIEVEAVDPAQMATMGDSVVGEPVENELEVAEPEASAVSSAPTFENSLDDVIERTIDAAPVTATQPEFTEELATVAETPDAIVAQDVEDPAPAPQQDATEADVSLDAPEAVVAPSSEPDFAPADRLEDATTAPPPAPTPTPAPSFEPALAELRRELAATQHGQQRIEHALTQLGTEMGDLGASLQKTLALAASTDGSPRLVLRPRRSVPGSILVAGAIALWSVVLWVKTGNGRLALLGIAAANIVFCGLHWARRR